MSFEHVAMAWRCGPDDLHQRAVLMVIIDFDAAGACFASVATIADQARVSASTVNRALRDLHADGWITEAPGSRPDSGRTRTWVPNIGKLEEAFAVVLAERAAKRKRDAEAKAAAVDKSRLDAVAEVDPCQTDRPPLSDRQAPPVRQTGEYLENESNHLSLLRAVLADRDGRACLDEMAAGKMAKEDFTAASRWLRAKFGLTVGQNKLVVAAYRQELRQAAQDAQKMRSDVTLRPSSVLGER